MSSSIVLVLVAGLAWFVGVVVGILIGRSTVRGRVERFEIATPLPSRKAVVEEIRALSKKLGVRVKISPAAELEDIVTLRNKLSARSRLEDITVPGTSDHEEGRGRG